MQKAALHDKTVILAAHAVWKLHGILELPNKLRNAVNIYIYRFVCSSRRILTSVYFPKSYHQPLHPPGAINTQRH